MFVSAREAVVWVDFDAGKVMVLPQDGRRPDERAYPGHWCDPIGAAYTQWRAMNNAQRVQLMLETPIDLAMRGVPLARVLKAFATVREFRALGRESYPMCRALTSALVGTCLEPNTMSFEELLQHYARSEGDRAIAT
jgi:hypothetical protein